ncbi:MAG: dephospho-CoA kinase [Cyanobium sp.]
MPDPAAHLDGASLALCRELASRLFPWDTNRALELALLKTFCLPSISGLLQRTGEFAQRPRKRYDDTALMVAELFRLGPDSPGGRAVIQRLNRIHGSYPISQADYAYVLSGFVAEPIRWLERYGWRPLTAGEQQALFRFWEHVGGLMGIEERPRSLAELLALNARVEAELFRSADSNRAVAEATVAMLLEPWPAPLRPALAAGMSGLLEPGVLRSLRWPASPRWLAASLRLALRGRSRLLALRHRLRPPRRQQFYSERPTPSYGHRFELEQLGPPHLLERLNSPRWRGPQRRIGLTGGIASGKSSAGRWLAEQGMPVLDADQFAREALAPGSPGAQAVLERYGAQVRAAAPGRPTQPTGGPQPSSEAAIDRAALGRIVFADAAERQWLEALVHPLVRQRFASELERLAAKPTVVLMIPLLFEADLEGLCSTVWLVDCSEAQQLQRLRARDGLSQAEAEARLAAQWPLERKRPFADRLIDNRGRPEALPSQLQDAMRHGAE